MSDKSQSPAGGLLPDPEEIDRSLKSIHDHFNERRGFYIGLGVLVLAGVIALLAYLSGEPASNDSEITRLWETCEPILKQYGRDLSATDELGELDRFIEQVRGTRAEGNAIWMAAIYRYREATTADKVTWEDRRPHLEKAAAYLKELADPRFAELDLLVDSPGWFTRSGPSPVQSLLEQIEEDTRWWRDHAYKEPVPDATQVVVLRTELGDIHLELFPSLAPKRCEAFVKLCTLGTYNGTMFHFVRGGNESPTSVMGGDPYTFFYNDPLKKEHILRWGKGGLGVDLPPEEARFKINHLRTIVTSQQIEQADWTNAVQFQIMIADDPSLDRVYTPFAKVVEGMAVVDAIAKRKTAAQHPPYKDDVAFTGPSTRDLLVEPVLIHKAIVYRDGKAIEHAFPLQDGEESISQLSATPVVALGPDQIYGGRALRSAEAAGEPRFGLDVPFPADVDPDKADPRGDRQ